ncbi:diphosphomevalonate decarboxylase [Agrococcus sp. SGAir0287]|uniref:diphosphomevalonate decarboxylase n=1 Tax=Agrococcus sp. SGAir0287 TaxID=2070347 RepID=UPI0010CCC2B3|nr:diphosphomevalonate decarboxylase [Agrococcus sp. SGAir0287]QCR18931.1 diphosphomevalonate decarboxylase [Agrococcus sp. SGAir0287]
MTQRATAVAHPNIALVKYWGKRDATMNLPATGSLSMTLDVFPTTTTVTVDAALDADTLELDGEERTGTPLDRVARFLDLVRAMAGSTAHARVVTTNAVPTGAGLASSASGFAALAVAAAAAYHLDLSPRELSRLARRGSGSASRSIVPGVAVWHAGDDDETSFAEGTPAPDMAMVIATVEEREKPVSSRVAMVRTAETSPFFPAWVTSTAETLERMVDACAAGDLDLVGRIAETNALRMHALIQSCDPPIRYLTAASLGVLDRVEALRAQGVLAYATIDAGPNVVVLCAPDDAERIAADLADVASTLVARPGPGARLVETIA